jgi:hypothetical protein
MESSKAKWVHDVEPFFAGQREAETIALPFLDPVTVGNLQSS